MQRDSSSSTLREVAAAKVIAPRTPRLPQRTESNRMGRYRILSRRDASLDPMHRMVILPME